MNLRCSRGHTLKSIKCAVCKDQDIRMEHAAQFVNAADTPEERRRRKIQVFPLLYSSPIDLSKLPSKG